MTSTPRSVSDIRACIYTLCRVHASKWNAPTRKRQFLRNAWIFLHQILLGCFVLYLLDVSRNDGNLNLKNEFCNWTNVVLFKSSRWLWHLCECDVKNHPILLFLVHEILRKFNRRFLICPPHLYTVAALYFEKCKKVIFNNAIHTYIHLFVSDICASECWGYYWIKLIITVIVQLSRRSLLETVRSDLPMARTYGVCYATVWSPRLTHNAPLEFSPCLYHPLPQLDHNPHSAGYIRSCIIKMR